MEEPLIRTSRLDGVLVISIDRPPVNALNAAVRRALLEEMRKVASDETILAVLLRSEGRQFIAGSDISEFDGPVATPLLTSVIEAFDDCRVAIVALIDGAALGGGFELALACDARIGTTSAVVGLPEVTLGILPGAGGTQRLPRLIGRAAALEMIMTGRQVRSAEALELGILDRLVEDSNDAERVALDFALTLPGRRRLRDAEVPVGEAPLEPSSPLDENVERARALVLAAGTRPFEEVLRDERTAFDELRGSFGARALRYVFFAERSVPEALRVDAPRTVQNAAVIGAGTMGVGIASILADAGIAVVLTDSESAARERAIETIERQLAERVRRGRASEDEARTVRAHITTAERVSDIGEVDFVIEAIVEDLDAKQAVLDSVASITAQGTVIATNTSYLDVNVLARASGRPADFVGMHFFHPARAMRLVEIVPGEGTSPVTVATAAELARRLKKVAVRSGPEEGFIGNRIYSAYRDQCERLLLEGATPSQVDRAMEAFGFAMGPFAVFDASGLDVAWARRKALRASGRLSNDATVADRLCEMGRLGMKTGAGFYRYEEGSRGGHVDPEVDAIINQLAAERGLVRQEVSEVAIQEANVAAMLLEAAIVMQRGTASDGRTIDVVEINGYGFPRKKGGPVFWARHQPREHLLDVVTDVAQKSDREFAISPLVSLLDEEQL